MKKRKEVRKMRKKVWKRFLAMGMAATMMLSAPILPIKAALPTMEGHGLTGEWYRAKEGSDRNDITRFTFEEERYIGSVKTGNLNGENFRPMIADLLGSGDDSQFVLASFTGELDVPKDEPYTFYMTGDDGFRLYLDGELVIDFWRQEWEKEQRSEPITLTKGRHDIRVEYLQGWGGAWLRMEWESPSITKQIIPEDVLYQKKESYYQEAKRALELEINKCQRAYEEIQGSEAMKKALEAAIARAIVIRDKDYSDVENIDEIILVMNQETEKLADAKSKLYLSTGVQPAASHTKFMNPLYQGQDPFIAQKDGFYYLVASSNDDSECKIYVSKSQTLTDQGEKKLVMDMTGKQRRIFAPELFFLDDEEGGHWYIYYCADILNYERDYPEMAGKYRMGSERHVACCLRSKTDDPTGEYEDMGPLYCGENGEILGANDITVVEYDGSLFGIWGTLGPNQPLGPAIVEFDTPCSITKDRDMLPIGGGEGPRALKNDKGELFVTMSEGGYSTDGYRLSVLCFTGQDKSQLLDAEKWYAKRDVFTSTTNVSGPARACFVKSADGTQDWMVYHSRVYKEVDDNWWRQINIKEFGWNEDGTPEFGSPASTNKTYSLPSGDPGQGDQYEAENAILEGGASIQSVNSNYYGEGYVHVPNKQGASVSFVVDAKDAGDYIVGLRYAYGVRKNGETNNRPSSQLPARAGLQVSVNGRTAGRIDLDKNSVTWNEWFTGSKRLPLQKGANLITYSVEQNCTGNVRLDALTMHLADVPYTSAKIRPDTISLEKDYAILQPGETTQIAARVLPENAADKGLQYHADQDGAAIVDAAGKVTAVKEGKTVISIVADGNKGVSEQFTVYVTKKQEGLGSEELEEALKKAQEAQEAAERAREEAERKIREAESAIEEAKTKVSEAERQAQEARDEADTARREANEAKENAERLQGDLNASQKEKEEAQKAAQEAGKRADDAEKRAEDAQKSLDTAQQELEAAKKGKDEAQRKLEVAEKELSTTKKALEDAKKKQESIQKELEDAKKAAQEAEKKLKELQNQNALKKGQVFSSGNLKYKVTDAKKKTVSVTGAAKKNLSSITVKANVTYKGVSYKITSVAQNAFKNNKKLTKVAIGDNVASIGNKAFYNNKKLKTVVLGKRVASIGKQAFNKDSKLNKITVKSTSLKSIGKNACKGIHKNAKIQVPKSKVKAYRKLFGQSGQPKTVKVK